MAAVFAALAGMQRGEGVEQEAWQILIVEDDQRLAELTRDYLQANGLRVSIEGNGALAAARIIKEQPDLVILDQDPLDEKVPATHIRDIKVCETWKGGHRVYLNTGD